MIVIFYHVLKHLEISPSLESLIKSEILSIIVATIEGTLTGKYPIT